MIDILFWVLILLCLILLFRYIKQINDRVTDTRKMLNNMATMTEGINSIFFSEEGYTVKRNGFMWDIYKNGVVVDSKPLASSAYKRVKRLKEEENAS